MLTKGQGLLTRLATMWNDLMAATSSTVVLGSSNLSYKDSLQMQTPSFYLHGGKMREEALKLAHAETSRDIDLAST